MKRIEQEIANLDKWQKQAAIESPDGPQRIIPNPVVHFETWTRNEILRNLGPAG